MKCKHIERLMIERSEGDFNEKELILLEEHVSRCSGCASLRDDLEKIRNDLKKLEVPLPSEELIRQTQLVCQSQMKKQQTIHAKATRDVQYKPIPTLIWAAIGILFFLTIILMVPLIKGLTSDLPLTFQTAILFVIMLQNAVTLCFAPILFRKFYLKHKDFRPIWKGHNAF